MEEPIKPGTEVINYAPAPGGRRRWRRRMMVVIALLLASGIAFGVWKWGKPARAQFDYMMEQREAMALALPADKVIYDDEPARMAALLANLGEYERTGQRFGRNGPAAHYWSAQWLGFRPGRFYDGFAFAGGRRTKAGRERIVFIMTEGDSGFGDPDVRRAAFYANPYIPAEWKLGSRIVYPRHVTTLYLKMNNKQHLRIYAGQRDPADASRLTFAYDVDGRPGVIEARLLDVGPDAPKEIRDSADDTMIDLRVLTGPALQLIDPD